MKFQESRVPGNIQTYEDIFRTCQKYSKKVQRVFKKFKETMSFRKLKVQVSIRKLPGNSRSVPGNVPGNILKFPENIKETP